MVETCFCETEAIHYKKVNRFPRAQVKACRMRLHAWNFASRPSPSRLPNAGTEMNQMTRQEILDAILPLNEPDNAARRLQWLINLGYQMTISARAGYPTVENKIEHLVAFNELQHQLYNQMLHCQTNDEWYKVEDLLENLRKYAVAAGVAGDFGWAVHASIRSLVNR